VQVEGGGFVGACFGGDALEEEGLADEGAPDEDFAAVLQLEEDAMVEEPGCMRAGEGGQVVELDEVAGADGGAEGLEALCESVGLRAGEQGVAWEAAENDVAGDKVD
jgi:hypothetical protein